MTKSKAERNKKKYMIWNPLENLSNHFQLIAQSEAIQYNAKHNPHILYANNDIGCFHHNKIVHMRHLMPLVSRSVAQSKMCKHKKHLGQICESCYCNSIPMEFRVFVRLRDQSMCDYTHTRTYAIELIVFTIIWHKQ